MTHPSIVDDNDLDAAHDDDTFAEGLEDVAQDVAQDDGEDFDPWDDDGDDHAETEHAPTLDAAPEASTEDPTADALEEARVVIDFRVGQAAVPVKDLRNLTTGCALTDLSGMLFPRAQAIAGGRVFAEGELVNIDGQIGFRIIRLAR